MIRLCLLNLRGQFQKNCLMLMVALFAVLHIHAANEPKDQAFVSQLVCHDHIQVSLDENCRATVLPQHLLEQFGFNVLYEVIARDWVTNKLVDEDPNTPFLQLGAAQIGTCLRVTIREISTGNSCWGKVCVEDKLPPRVDCPRDLTIECYESSDPSFTGTPGVYEACGGYTLTYKDIVSKGSCQSGYDKIISRHFIAVDESGNRDTCIQTITVALGDLNNLTYPLNYDGLLLPGHTYALSCDAKYDSKKNVSSHILAYPDCVDGYLLDSSIFIGSGQRLPKKLGWNCIDVGPFAGHPSPHPVYYPANGACWDDNVVMWEGTGEPGNAGCSNIATTFRDIRIDISKPGCDAGPVGCYKLLRVWTLLNWCTGEVKDTNQIIKVMDLVPPTVLYPDSLVINTDPWRCEGRWDVAPAWVLDNCSNEVHYSIRVESGTVLGNDVQGYVVVNLPLGIQNAYIVAEDCCGNITERRVVLDVQDNTPPNAVCDRETVVTLTGSQSPGDNTAKVYASTFDDGSFDNCSNHLYFKVIRMDELLGTNNGSLSNNDGFCNGVNGDDDNSAIGNQIYFDDYVKFCCADAGKSIMVVFRVFDRDPGAGPVHPYAMNQNGYLFNRFSDCMVEVEVQDKSIPTVVAPPDIVVSCMFWFDIDAIKDPNNDVFGKVVSDLAWRAKVKTTDLVCSQYCSKNTITGYPGYIPVSPPNPIPAPTTACNYYNSYYNPAHPNNKYELVWGFDGYILSSCNATPEIEVRDLRECGQGRILRDVSVAGPNGQVITATQTIWVVNCDPFYVNRANYCDDQDDIIWPDCERNGTFIEGCGADISPDNPALGRPEIVQGARNQCSLIAVEHFDEVFTIEPDACYKILRKWVVIDWCQYEPNSSATEGRWEFTQIIKVRDLDKPVINNIELGQCEPAEKLNGICHGHLNIIPEVTDNCTPEDWLNYEYKIDLYNDGKGTHSGNDLQVGPLTKKEFAAGRTPLFNDNPYADDNNNPFDASGTYPEGVHKICFYVEDGCGNLGTGCTLFEIKDCKAPTPYCLTGIITVPMPTSGCVDIWAKDLDFNSFDNCTPKNKLKFYFDGDTSKRSIRVCCDDFVAKQKADELTIDVQVWVEDEEGNRDYCSTVVIVQDNQNICPNPPTLNSGNVNGFVKTENGEFTAKAAVELFNANTLVRQSTTNNNGNYLFGDLNLNSNYMIKSKRLDDAANGVTTADIVKIQRHILGMELLTSPYKLIAADVNKTYSITAADISEIRKLILGVTAEFPKVSSWLMIPSDFTFSNPQQPWDFPTEKNFVTLNPSTKIDFVAVKMGDVNNSASASGLLNVTGRNADVLNLHIDDRSLTAGETFKMTFKSSDFNQISGMQMTLKFDQDVLSFESFEAGVLHLDESNFGFQSMESGLIAFSWNDQVAVSAENEEVLFTLTFIVLANSQSSKVISLNNAITAVEAYDHALNTKDIQLTARSGKEQKQTTVFELYQNTPNPFDKQTTISFKLTDAADVQLTIYDVTGKVAYLNQFSAHKGTNSVKIDKTDLPGGGIYYYQLDAADRTATKRMVILD
ncbi:MAG: T9SS type A sorting domain-containing protein [Saprospiraceae bacterium]|nr:T9SS type A sorting domain-containing protein [Saprospiraceae bacterium]